MKRILVLSVLLFTFICLNAQELLYKSDAFTITHEKVIQDEFEAEAKSEYELTSNYRSNFKKKTGNLISFKFSINGGDNENYPGNDHRLLLNPTNGKYESPIYTFGKPHSDDHKNIASGFLYEDLYLKLKVDMRQVLNDFKNKGFYLTFNGEKINSSDFKGLFVAGGTYPLTWNFNSPGSLIELKDNDSDGIFETTIKFKKEFSPDDEIVESHWKLSKDISHYPAYKSPHKLIDALYNKALEEMILDIREDGAFMAGAKWPGVWTRDISYSILLSLAVIAPDASKISLMAKVKNGKIIQDTGTGGAWPVSTDRMIWAVAAWEIFNVTGDKEWLRSCYRIIKNSADDDLNIIYDKSTGLFRGESSFLDWREQTYPLWMDPKDIFNSENLGTNAVHYKTYLILCEMAKLLNEPFNKFETVAKGIKAGINKHLWMDEKGYYGQYLYGRNFLSLSPKSEALGEALSVLFDVPEKERQQTIISSTPVTEFGITCIYPQIPGIPPYHNDAIWPFVETYWAWASAKTNNTRSVEKSLASIYRAAALFGTNKENFVACTGDYLGTEINSSRQLWSVAGNLASVYRIIFGMNFYPDSLTLKPFIPEVYKGTRSLENFKYRNANLSIIINGFGNEIKSVFLDGNKLVSAVIPADIKGNHTLEINMNGSLPNGSKINLVDNLFSPEAPVTEIISDTLKWNKIDNVVEYTIYRNGKPVITTKETFYKIDDIKDFAEYQVLRRDKNRNESFLSIPAYANSDFIMIEAEEQNSNPENSETGYSGNGYISLEKHSNADFSVDINESGEYILDFRYANGNGPINTSNKCAIRDLSLNGFRLDAIVFPQRGDGIWNNWGYSNSVKVKLNKGNCNFKILFSESNNNMNVETNAALIDYMRLIRLPNK